MMRQPGLGRRYQWIYTINVTAISIVRVILRLVRSPVSPTNREYYENTLALRFQISPLYCSDPLGIEKETKT